MSVSEEECEWHEKCESCPLSSECDGYLIWVSEDLQARVRFSPAGSEVASLVT